MAKKQRLLRKKPSRRSRNISNASPFARRLLLEQLEDRRLLAVMTWTGDGVDDLWSRPKTGILERCRSMAMM